MKKLGTFYEVVSSPRDIQKKIYNHDVETIERKVRQFYQKMDKGTKALYRDFIEKDLAQLRQFDAKMK
jgi:hypothetical protein